VPFPSVSGRLRHGASFPTRRSSDLATVMRGPCLPYGEANVWWPCAEAVRHTCGVELDDSTTDARRKVESTVARVTGREVHDAHRSEEHTSELQSRPELVCRLRLAKK